MLPAGMFVFQLLFVTLSAVFRNSRLLEGGKKVSMRPRTQCVQADTKEQAQTRLYLSSLCPYVLTLGNTIMFFCATILSNHGKKKVVRY